MSLQIETYKEEIASLRTRLGTLEGLGERTAELSTSQEQLAADLEETNEQMSTLLNDVDSLVERINLEEDRTDRFENFFIDLNTLLKNLLVSEGE